MYPIPSRLFTTKSLQKDIFYSIEKTDFYRLAGMAAQMGRGFIVYGGDQPQTRGTIHAIGWRELRDASFYPG